MMSQRIVTALILSAVAVALLALGGVVMAVAIMVIICFAVHEEYHALSLAGHRPVSWPTWVGVVLSVPMLALGGAKLLLPVVLGVCMVTMIMGIFRAEPKLEDILMSLLPLLTVVLPGLAAISLTGIEPHALQVTLMMLMVVVPCLCDTFAFFIGGAVRGPKLCPAVSPNKTISGAIGGLIGGLLGAVLVGLIAYAFGGASRPMLPEWWHYVILGLVGSVAGQLGDLFASLVKRHCGIKDFSNLFPGHGGMLDRLDSIFFMALVMFCYRILTAA